MFNRLIEFVLPSIIGITVHKQESLTEKELHAQSMFFTTLATSRKTKQPMVVALIGLVGSEKSSVASELAEHISATVIEGNRIRVHLRKEGEHYKGARKIAENVLVRLVSRGENVILDSDHIDPKKRASLRQKVKKTRARLIFIRIHADYDIMAGRIIAADYQNQPDDFFGGASTKWKGDEQSRGAVVKLREMWRRTPHHYRWQNKGGDKWIQKKLPFSVFAEIDTSDAEWRKEVQKIGERLLSF